MSISQRILKFKFHPNQGFKLYWDLFVIFLSIYNSFVIPLQFSIPDSFTDKPIVSVVDVIIDYLFALDIFINFRTIYIDPKSEEAIRDTKKICINYF